MMVVRRWSVPLAAAGAAAFDAAGLAAAGVLTIRVSCSPQTASGAIAIGFAAVATVLAAHRPFVVAFVTPQAIWSST
jgi:hypothetical protein